MNKAINERESNIELLRLVAMFLVLVVHTGATSLSSPTFELIEKQPLNAVLQLFTQSISIVCVNVFVLISGWFGIKLSTRGVLNFIFQCLYYSVATYLLFILLPEGISPLRGLFSVFYLDESRWFVKSYLLLMFLSPVLNSFVTNAPRRQFEVVLILFFSFQTIFGWGSHGVSFFNSGYSTISFVGLYLLSRYANTYKPFWLQLKKSCYFMIYFATVLVNVSMFLLCYYLSTRYQVDYIETNQSEFYWQIFSYYSPFAIVGAFSLVVLFSQLDLGKNRFLNHVALSSFAIYLIHCNRYTFPYFTQHVRDLYAMFSGQLQIYYGRIFLFILIVFLASIIIDQFRIFIWKYMIEPRLLNRKNSKEYLS